MTVAMLNRRIYSLTGAAKILGIHSPTLRRWLDGEVRGAKSHAPIIRTEITGSNSVTWAEFVESALLCQYRRKLDSALHEFKLDSALHEFKLGLALHELKDFINFLRYEHRNPYPLAHYKPWVGPDRHLLLEAQQWSRLPGELWLVAPANGQLLLTPPAHSFLERVEWNDGVAAAWRCCCLAPS